MEYVSRLLGYNNENKTSSSANTLPKAVSFEIPMHEPRSHLPSALQAKLSTNHRASKNVLTARMTFAEKRRKASLERRSLRAREHFQNVRNAVMLQRAERESARAQLQLKLILRDEHVGRNHDTLEKSKVLGSHSQVAHAKETSRQVHQAETISLKALQLSVQTRQHTADNVRKQQREELQHRLREKWAHHSQVSTRAVYLKNHQQ